MTFRDLAQWSVAANHQPNIVVQSENFTNNQITSPDLSITTRSGMGSILSSGSGVISNQLWTDCVGKNGCNGMMYDTTTFSFDKPVFSFGGDFDLQAALPGGLEIYLGDSPRAVSPNQYFAGRSTSGRAYDGFFGFTSDVGFTTITFASSMGYQPFTLGSIVFGIDPPPTTVPEPGTFALIGLAGAAALSLGKRVCQSSSRVNETEENCQATDQEYGAGTQHHS